MQAANSHLFKRHGRKEIELEVEEELRFHIEMLREKYIEQGMSQKEAKDATLKRFGDVEQVKGQCVEISRRSNRLLRALKSFLILTILTGVFVRAVSTDVSIGRVGEMLIAVAVLTHLLLYTHGLSPSSFLSKNEIPSPRTLIDGSRTSPAAHAETNRKAR